MKRLAVVLFNLGGPDGPDAVRPFLFNLFNDPAIIGAPTLIRRLLASFISKKRAPVAQEIYSHMGGKSPILALTREQGAALEKSLNDRYPDVETRAFVCMRYWHPMSDAAAKQVFGFDPDQIVLLPLYPQYSTSTTESALLDWERAAAKAGIDAPAKRICCYPTQPGWIKAQADLLNAALAKVREQAPEHSVRVLFSAHGLPKKIVEGKGDPYPKHVEQGAKAIAETLAAQGTPIDDWLVSYQSRVGPLEWIGPSTDAEIERAGRDGVALVVLPIAFVSEHSETLVELDIEYKHLAQTAGVSVYERVPAVATHPDFIDGLAAMVTGALATPNDPCPHGGAERVCDGFSKACPARIIG